ncbi:MAG: AAA family ATPase [Dehalococcoidia bacterium]
MKITHIIIQNLGSLKKVSLENLHVLTVIVGKNGSGKSYLFNALQLFFSEFQIIGGSSAYAGNVDLWHRRNTRNPIRVDITLALSTEEARNFVPEWVDLLPKTVIEDQGQNPLRIARELTYGMGWKTPLISFMDREFVKEDTLVPNTSGQLSDSAMQKQVQALSPWSIHFFDPQASQDNPVGAKLIVKDEARQAYLVNDEFDPILHQILIYETERGMDYNAWAAEQGFSLEQRVPTEEEAPELYEAIRVLAQQTSSPAQPALLEQTVKQAFKLVPAARDAQLSSDIRSPMLESSVLDSITQMASSREPVEEAKFDPFRAGTEDLLEKRLEPIPGQMLVRQLGERQTVRVPVGYIGGGEQAIFGLEWAFLDAPPIVAIEEPENHLHPGLAKREFQRLQSRLGQTQIFVGTHSSMFLDKEHITNNWLFTQENLVTKVERIEKPGQFKYVMAELGLVPSDVFLKDLVVFLEGDTEKQAVFPIWAKTLGVSLTDNPLVGLINIGGESKLEKILRSWLSIMEYAPADYIAILDAHGGAVRDKIEREIEGSQGKIKVLSKHAIEDYYPPARIVDAFKSLYDIDLQEGKIPKENRPAVLVEKLKEAKVPLKGWKVELGMYVASRMPTKEIPSDVRTIIEEIKAMMPSAR